MCKYIFERVKFNKENFDLIQEVYRLHMDQRRKLFDLACGISIDEDIMDYVEDKIRNDLTIVAIDKDNNNKVCGCFILEDGKAFDKIIVRANLHAIICRAYWGKTSRDITNQFFSYLKSNYPLIKRLEARVPSQAFGVVKILKDVGFKLEGTLKDSLIFLNKNKEYKFYNELVYSKIDKEVIANG